MRLTELPTNVILAILEQLDESRPLKNAGLTCRVLRELSLPSLLYHVDISCHNNKQISEPTAFELFNRRFRPDRSIIRQRSSLGSGRLMVRQRSFLQLMVDKPELCKHVKAFVWSLRWIKPFYGETKLTSVDYKIWDVFGQMKNVTHLDLGSQYEVPDINYVRQNPPMLFPSVIDLRLSGTMHRNLVKAIFNAVDPDKLKRLTFD